MASKSKGRGTAAAFGLVFVLAGLAGGAVLFVLSVKRPDQAVDGFGRAPIGCTTTLEFTETGTFYVFEEHGAAVEVPVGSCQPLADPATAFGFALSGPDGPVARSSDTSLSYDTGDYTGESVARVQIAAPGRYDIVARGNDVEVVAAIGRDPDDGVSELRQRAIIVAAVGVLLGGLFLVLSGRRSKRAATFASPDAPIWSSRADDETLAAVEYTRVAQVPVNPHAPLEPVSIAPELWELKERLDHSPHTTETSPWAAPTPDQAATVPPEQPEPDTAVDGE